MLKQVQHDGISNKIFWHFNCPLKIEGCSFNVPEQDLPVEKLLKNIFQNCNKIALCKV